MFIELPVSQFLDRLASADPTPGGGSGAALVGALGAALVSMVCRLTIDKKGYEAVQTEIAELLAEAEALRTELPRLLEADAQVYAQVMMAYRQSHKTDGERAAREHAIQTALQAATEVPLQIAERCAQVLPLALRAAELGNRWGVSDAGVGAVLAEAAAHGALLNVEINLASMTDEDYVRAVRTRMTALMAELGDAKRRVLAIVHDRIGA